MNNNLQSLIEEFAKSGKTRAQVAIILDKMGIIPELIESGLNTYYPKKTIMMMTIKEKLNLEGRINNLKEALKGYSVDSAKGYYIDQITEICDRYLKPIVAESSQVKIDAAIAKINELKQSLAEYNIAVTDGKKEIKPDEINAVMENISQQQVHLTNYTNTQRDAAINKYSHAILAKQMLRELKQFDWINPVGQFIMEVDKALLDNTLSVAVEEAYASLNASSTKDYYKVGLEKLNELRSMSEEDMRKAVNVELSSLRWVPQINAVYEQNIKLSNDVDNDENNIVLKRHSYVVEHAEGLLFSLNSQPYFVKESNIIPVDRDKVNTLFLTLMAIEETFRFNIGEMITSKGNNIISLAVDENKKPIFKFNGKVVEMKDGEALRQYLLTTGGYRINEQSIINTIVATYENINNIKELDFVRSITSRKHNGLQYNVMKLDENIFINKVNTYMGHNTFEKYDSAEEAVKEVKEALNYDISPVVFEQLAAEKQAAAKLDEQKAELLDNILFLKEKREELSKADQTNVAIKDATSLLVSEIEKFQKQYNALIVECEDKKKKGKTEENKAEEEFIKNKIKESEKVTEGHLEPGIKVKCPKGNEGTVQSWDETALLYNVLFDGGETAKFKEGELTKVE